MTMAGRLDGKSVLITGAAAGIGRATAIAAAREGARLTLSDVTTDAGEQVAKEITAAGGKALFLRCDVTQQADVDAMVKRAVDSYGRIDCAFNNAGIEGTLAPLADYPEETFQRVLQVNVVGLWRCLRAEIPVMVKQGGGAIVNTSSVGGLVGAGAFGAYVASKHAVVGLTKTCALDYAKQGIRVNAVCPGVIQTPMLDRLADLVPGLVDALLAVKPMGRLGSAEEVAEAVIWLLSDSASFTTGATLTIDGGFTTA
jgi:NAD(P)-dependent dehydrogenase (short-subunit alcohol dehydrogenase family)